MIALVAALAVAAVALAEEAPPTREGYVAKVEPICQANTEANERILKGAKERVKHGQLAKAGNQFIRAAKAFGRTVGQIVAVPRPPADSPRLEKWFKFLKIIQSDLKKIGTSLKAGNKVRATHESIRAERSGNAANNVSFIFEFHYCKITPSRFR
jgi:acetylornithine/succinyldiaminopimelate/putrescine aminotransferase